MTKEKKPIVDGKAVSKTKDQQKLGQNLRGRRTADSEYVKALEKLGQWSSAQEIAKELGVSWYTTAHVLRRLVEACQVEEQVIEVVGVKRAKESSRVYRARLQLGQSRRTEHLLPAWLAPQGVAEVGQPRRVIGKAGITRWDEQRGKDPEEDQA